MSQLRSSILAESERLATKSRFGMFSVPPPLALGDDSKYQQKKHPRDQNGKPVTKPRNLLSGINRSGMGKKGYFGVPDSIYQGDKYEDPFKRQITYQRKMHSKSNYHENDFKPASGYKTLVKSSYQYIEQKAQRDRKRKLDENGRVWTQPKNVTTNPTNKVERQFMKNPQYIADPYDRKKQQQIQERKVWKSKLPEASWKYVANSIETFGKDKITYGIDDKAKSLIEQKKKPRSITLKTVTHDTSFCPVKKVGNQPIGKYPEAMSAQLNKTQRPRAVTQGKQQDKWRPNDGLTKSKPTPSISLNKKNIHIARYK